MIELKQRIINKSEGLFMRYGIKSVTMDDIARELGISKKTLYQYFDNKTDLIEQIFDQKVCDEKDFIGELRENATDSIEEILKIGRFVVRQLRQISPTAVYDLQKYYRTVYRKMEGLHQQFLYAMIYDNIRRGIEQGVYREDINIDIVTKLYVGKNALVADDELFPLKDYKLEELFQEHMTYHLHGIASKKGLLLLERHLENLQDTEELKSKP